MQKAGRKNKKYSAEFKIHVIMDMRENGMSYHETVRKYWQAKTRAEESNHMKTVKLWERIYIEEGAASLMEERRGRKSKGRPQKEPSSTPIENDLIAENQRLKERLEWLEMENEYLKKLDALIRAEEGKNGKKP